MVILEASRANACQFCTGVHVVIARIMGMDDAPLRLLDQPDRHTTRQCLALEYARAAMVDANRVSDELFGRLREQFSDAEIVELTFLIGSINRLSLFYSCLQVTCHGEYEAAADDRADGPGVGAADRGIPSASSGRAGRRRRFVGGTRSRRRGPRRSGAERTARPCRPERRAVPIPHVARRSPPGAAVVTVAVVAAIVRHAGTTDRIRVATSRCDVRDRSRHRSSSIMHRTPMPALSAVVCSLGAFAMAPVVTASSASVGVAAAAEVHQAADKPEAIVVAFHADWCGHCKKLGPKLMKEVVPELGDSSYLMVKLDLTGRESKQAEYMMAGPGLEKAWEAHGGRTGFALVIDGKTREVKHVLRPDHSPEAMVRAIRSVATSRRADEPTSSRIGDPRVGPAPASRWKRGRVTACAVPIPSVPPGRGEVGATRLTLGDAPAPRT